MEITEIANFGHITQYFFGFNLIKPHPRRNRQHLKYVDLSYQEFRPSSKMLTVGLSTNVTWLPKNLVYLDLAHTQLDWSWYNCIDLNENNSLQFVNLTNTGLTHLRQPVRCKKGIQLNVRMLNLDGNDLQCINKHFFSDCDWRN